MHNLYTLTISKNFKINVKTIHTYNINGNAIDFKFIHGLKNRNIQHESYFFIITTRIHLLYLESDCSTHEG